MPVGSSCISFGLLNFILGLVLLLDLMLLIKLMVQLSANTDVPYLVLEQHIIAPNQFQVHHTRSLVNNARGMLKRRAVTVVNNKILSLLVVTLSEDANFRNIYCPTKNTSRNPPSRNTVDFIIDC